MDSGKFPVTGVYVLYTRAYLSVTGDEAGKMGRIR